MLYLVTDLASCQSALFEEEPTPADLENVVLGLSTLVRLSDRHEYDKVRREWLPLTAATLVSSCADAPDVDVDPFHTPISRSEAKPFVTILKA